MVNRTHAFGMAALVGAAMLAPAGSADAALVYGLTDENKLVSFDSANPAHVLSAVPISGRLGQDLIGIDFRPANAQLYAVGEFGTIYTINRVTGAATTVAQLSTPLQGSRFGIDFNPMLDRLRIVSDADINLSVDVTTGVVTSQTGLSPSTANIVGAAYSNNFNGGASTTLFTLDSVGNTLNIQDPASGGVQTVAGTSNLDFSNLTGLDIDTPVGTQNTAYLVLQDVTQGVSQLYTVNLNAGTPTLTPAGVIGGGDLFDGVAVFDGVGGRLPEPGILGLAAVASLGMLRRRRR